MLETIKRLLKEGQYTELFNGRVTWHWQNLNEKPGDKSFHPSGSGLIHGRCWLVFHYGKKTKRNEYPKDFTTRLCWHLWSRYCMAEVELKECDDDLVFHWAVPPVALWLSFSGLPKWMQIKDWNRNTGISIHDWTVFLKFWCNESEWSCTGRDYRGRWLGWSKSLNIPDILLGRSEYKEDVLYTEPVEVPMPERCYKGQVKILKSTWTRKRWPIITINRTMTRSKLDMDEGEQVPVPGKGENSWDCGEDAIFGQTAPAPTPVEAVVSMVKSALETRRRHGGKFWRPAPKKPKLVPPPDPEGQDEVAVR